MAQGSLSKRRKETLDGRLAPNDLEPKVVAFLAPRHMRLDRLSPNTSATHNWRTNPEDRVVQGSRHPSLRASGSSERASRLEDSSLGSLPHSHAHPRRVRHHYVEPTSAQPAVLRFSCNVCLARVHRRGVQPFHIDCAMGCAKIDRQLQIPLCIFVQDHDGPRPVRESCRVRRRIHARGLYLTRQIRLHQSCPT